MIMLLASSLQTNKAVQEIWSRRSLIMPFAMTDLRRRYRNSALGFLWSVLEPLLLLSVLVVVFTNLYRNSIPHFVIFLLLNIILWQFFTRGTQMGVNCILNRGRAVSKIYFPREILPISSSLASFLMLLIEFVVFIAFILVFQFIPSPTIVLLPVAVALEFILVLGISFALSALNVYYRDIQHMWAIISYAGFFLTPIFYTLDRFPHAIKSLILLNPMAQIIEMAHNSVLYDSLPTVSNLSYTVIFCVSTLGLGLLIFRKLEGRLAEEI
jgi:lipopolysaccharide transport system permease protein